MSPVRLLVTSAAFGSSVCSATAAAPLSPEEAASHVGETTTVRGVVASAEHEANEQNTRPPGRRQCDRLHAAASRLGLLTRGLRERRTWQRWFRAGARVALGYWLEAARAAR